MSGWSKIDGELLTVQVNHLQVCIGNLVAERDRLEATVTNYRALAADDHCTCSQPQETNPLLHRQSCMFRSHALEAEPYLKESEAG